MRKLNLDLLFILLIILIIAVYFIPLFYPQPQFVVNSDFGKSDSLHMGISTKYMLWEKLQNNQLPLWTNKISSGFPLLGEGQIGMFFIPNLILYKLFSFVHAYNISLVLSVVLISVGTYLWLRKWQLSSFVSFFGAIILAFSGIVMTHLTHITLLQSLGLMPWIMLTTYILANNKSIVNILLFGFIISQQLLAGFPQAVFISLIYSGVYYLWLIGIGKKYLKQYLIYVLAGLVSLLLSAIQLLPSREFLMNSTDPNGFDLQTASYYSYPFKHLLTFIDPFLLGNPKSGSYPPFAQFSGSVFWENTGYVGLIPLLIIIFFFTISFFKRKKIQYFIKNHHIGNLKKIPFYSFLVLILFGSFLLMTGSNSPIYLIYDLWPFNLFRVPSRFIWIFVFTLVIFAAYGFEFLLSMFRSNLIRKSMLVIIITLCFLQLEQNWSKYNTYNPTNNWISVPSSAELISKSDKVLDIGAEALYNKTFLKSGWQDINPYLFLKNDLYPNSNVIWQIYQHQASVGRFLQRPQIVDNWLMSYIFIDDNEIKISSAGLKLINLLGINTIITAYPILQQNNWKLIKEMSYNLNKLYFYHNSDSVLRAYLVNKSITSDILQDMQAKIIDQNFIPGNNVLVENPVDISSSGKAGSAEIIQDNDTEVKIRVKNNQGNSLLVITDTYYPGWEATVDNRLIKIIPVNIRQKGIMVPDGDHEVVFSYKPQSFLIGAWISGISHVLILGYLIYNFIITRGLNKGTKFTKSPDHQP